MNKLAGIVSLLTHITFYHDFDVFKSFENVTAADMVTKLSCWNYIENSNNREATILQESILGKGALGTVISCDFAETTNGTEIAMKIVRYQGDKQDSDQ